MRQWVRALGSLKMAVPLLIAIAAVLAWGTIYEARFGTASVQRVVYHAWWFQALLGFLAVNLAVAALQRLPWKRQHVPFVLAHIGIILILLGGILGGRFGVDGQLIIPEGQAERTLQLQRNVLVVHQPNPGVHQIIPVQFETQAWVHEPQAVFPVALGGRSIALTVDRYYPDAVTEEQVTTDGTQENPAVHVELDDQGQQDALWLVARDPERFGAGWGEAHVLFLAPETQEQVDQLVAPIEPAATTRGRVTIQLPGLGRARELTVPDAMGQEVALKGTPYCVTFKDYFDDFALTEQGPASRSDQPNNPAVSFVLTGPEGTDAYLLFAFHPEFQSIHGLQHRIPAQISYTHSAGGRTLPPNTIALIRTPAEALLAVLTGRGAERTVITPLILNTRYTHPSLGYQVTVHAYAPKAVVQEQISNRGNDIKAEMLHVIAREGIHTDAAWLGLRQTVTLQVGGEPIAVEFRPDAHDLPFTIKLLDFRKLTYPGIDMASSFESDVELSDPQRGLILMRTIKMNHPLRYRGFSLFQSSYVEGPTETTVLSVRNDPGTPFVYAGFLIVILGVASLFALRTPRPQPATTRRHR